jgi:hypothetical protein
MTQILTAEFHCGLGQDAWVDAVLPIVRVRKVRPLTVFPLSREVVALYRDELVVARARASRTVPDSVYEPDGADTLRAYGAGSAMSVRLSQVRSLLSERRSVIRTCDRVWAVTPERTLHVRVRA